MGPPITSLSLSFHTHYIAAWLQPASAARSLCPRHHPLCHSRRARLPSTVPHATSGSPLLPPLHRAVDLKRAPSAPLPPFCFCVYPATRSTHSLPLTLATSFGLPRAPVAILLCRISAERCHQSPFSVSACRPHSSSSIGQRLTSLLFSWCCRDLLKSLSVTAGACHRRNAAVPSHIPPPRRQHIATVSPNPWNLAGRTPHVPLMLAPLTGLHLVAQLADGCHAAAPVRCMVFTSWARVAPRGRADLNWICRWARPSEQAIVPLCLGVWAGIGPLARKYFPFTKFN
jgi:hypothetical protein